MISPLSKIAKVLRVLNKSQSDVPLGATGWKVQISSNIGIMKDEKADLILTSEGTFFNRDTEAKSKFFNPKELLLITQLISNITIPDQNNSILPFSIEQLGRISLCKDCQTTTLQLSRRETDGTIKTLNVMWEEDTKAEITKDTWQIYEDVRKLVALK